MMEEYFVNPHPIHIGSGRDLQGIKKDGVLIPVEIGVYPYNSNVIVTIVDINIRKAKKMGVDMQKDMQNLAEKIQKTIETFEQK